MVVRVARFRQQPERFTRGDYHWVLDAIRKLDGFEAAYDLVDDRSGDSISVGVFENEEAVRTAEEQVGVARRALGIAASPPDTVEIWRVVDQA
jgi:hypothetical protein